MRDYTRVDSGNFDGVIEINLENLSFCTAGRRNVCMYVRMYLCSYPHNVSQMSRCASNNFPARHTVYFMPFIIIQ